MRVEIFATERHYMDHLEPIWEALPEEARGAIHPIGDMRPCDPGCLGLVAGGVDAHLLRHDCKVIYVEHGAGQSYMGAELAAAQMPGYSGADGWRWRHVVGFISPAEDVARNWTSAPSVAVGCPKMDRHILTDYRPTRSVCFAWHWDATFVQEARWTWDHWAWAMPQIVRQFKAQGYWVFGHAHPRWKGGLDERLEWAGMEILPTDADVFACAQILFVDNSSLGPEFASLGRPVYWLNAPKYRRDVTHGKRFWEWTDLAPTVDEPDGLMALDLDLIASPTPHPLAVAAYAHIDGKASERAAEFIVRRLADLGS